MNVFIVLWVFHSTVWSFGPLQMTRGWHSAAIFADIQSCSVAISARAKVGLAALCLPAPLQPTGPLSEVIREVTP